MATAADYTFWEQCREKDGQVLKPKTPQHGFYYSQFGLVAIFPSAKDDSLVVRTLMFGERTDARESVAASIQESVWNDCWSTPVSHEDFKVNDATKESRAEYAKGYHESRMAARVGKLTASTLPKLYANPRGTRDWNTTVQKTVEERKTGIATATRMNPAMAAGVRAHTDLQRDLFIGMREIKTGGSAFIPTGFEVVHSGNDVVVGDKVVYDGGISCTADCVGDYLGKRAVLEYKFSQTPQEADKYFMGKNKLKNGKTSNYKYALQIAQQMRCFNAEIGIGLVEWKGSNAEEFFVLTRDSDLYKELIAEIDNIQKDFEADVRMSAEDGVAPAIKLDAEPTPQPPKSIADVLRQMDFNNPQHLAVLGDTYLAALSNLEAAEAEFKGIKSEVAAALQKECLATLSRGSLALGDKVSAFLQQASATIVYSDDDDVPVDYLKTDDTKVRAALKKGELPFAKLVDNPQHTFVIRKNPGKRKKGN